MILILFIVLSLVSVLAVFPIKEYQFRLLIYVFIGAILIMIAGLRGPNVGSDYMNYIDKYNEIVKDSNGGIIEISFVLISYLTYYVFDNVVILFLIYAAIGVSLKFLAIKELSGLWFLSLIIYLGNFYILQEMTQIRVGIATGFFLLSIKPIYDRDWKKFLLFFAGAFFFHYSSLLMLPLWFLSLKPQKIFLVLAIPIAYLIYFMGLDFINISIPIPAIQEKLDIYNSLKGLGTDWMDEINVFNLVFCVKIILFLILLWKYDTVSKHNKYFPLLMKIYCLSLFAFPVLGTFPVAAFRVSEFFGVVEIILFPLLIFTTKPARYSIPIIIILGFSLFLISQQTLFVN